MPFPFESLEQIQVFFWVLVRISLLIFLFPFLGARGIPTIWKVGFSLILAVILTPLVPSRQTFPQTLPEVLLGLMTEAAIGLILAFSVNLVFASVQLAGQFMAFQMGFAMASAVDPITEVESTVLSQLLYLFTILVFLSLDGHHYLIQAIANSFYVIRPDAFSLNPPLSRLLIEISGQMFLIGLKIAAPLLVALFLSNLSLGIVARTVPQMNILMIGFPVNIGLGLILLGLVMGHLFPFLRELTTTMGETLNQLIHLM